MPCQNHVLILKMVIIDMTVLGPILVAAISLFPLEISFRQVKHCKEELTHNVIDSIAIYANYILFYFMNAPHSL